MPVLHSANIESALIQYVESWVDLLARGDWDGAMALVEVPNYYGVLWTTADVRRALIEYGGGTEPAVTDPHASSERPRISTGAFDDGTGYWVDIDLPLEGAWTDLTAQFEFRRSGTHYFATLHDLHVL